MPIRPEMKRLYPPPKEWRKIRAAILQRADNRCETCRVEHRELICRGIGRNAGTFMREDGETFHEETGESTGEWWRGSEYDGRFVDVVLTIAHLDHDPTNNDETNLRALCQLHHLRLDAGEHAKNAATTRRKKHEERTGQRRLFGETAKEEGKR